MPIPIAIPTAIKLLPWRYIGVALAVAAALWFAFDTGRDNMRAKLQPRIALLTRERDTARANVTTLERAIARQNAAIAFQAAKGRNAQQGATRAAKQGRERAPAVAATVAKLEAVKAGGQCMVAGEVRTAWSNVR